MAVDDDDDNEWEDEWEDEWENEWEDEWEDELRNDSLHHVEPDSSALQCFNLARHWLHDCLANHESCRLEPTPHLPKTFLQISSGRRHPEARLMTDTGLKETYAALSHCWGTAEFLTLTRANFGSLEQNVPWENLPKAFQDAIKVCLELGLSNLWIDSLCILQDSREDWEEQSACMGDIYRNATVVIAANSGSGAHEGFLGPRKEQFVECIVPPSSASPGVYARPHILHYCELSTDETLSKRAWTYQERLLARRYLSFNKKELHWECESAWQCECGVGEWTKGSPHEFSLQQLCNVTMNKEELYKVWRQVIVQNYAGRELSKESDELPALSAVAQVFQTKLQDTYLAGLWNGDIIRGLCWVRASWFEQYPNGPPSYRAPSWAWSSIDAPVDDRSGQQEFVTYSQLLEAECVPFGASNLGEVKDGFITLRGPLVRAFIGLSACGFNPGEIVQVWTFNVRDGSSTVFFEHRYK
ncbi:hypothetical protein PG989_010293 [Apiospora arundinis]|uniref:HET-domain-containing protein n=1 Tax=Apiospora arundinis TaxID=335852 RepID=A0ABR2JBJ7_9PEZI